MVYDLRLFDADATLKFNTKIDETGFSAGVNNLGGIFKQGLGVLVGNLMTQGLHKISELGKAAIGVGASFEAATSQIAATMGKQKSEIQNIIDEAKRLGAETAFSASQAAEGFNILAQSGLNASEQIATMENVLNLAAAGSLNLESAASYVTGAVKGFNDEMANSGYYADLMAKGASLANTDVNLFGVAMSDAAASMNSYNQSAEETALALLRLAEQNVTGAEAATALNRAMMDLYTPTAKAGQKLDELGVSAYDLTTGAARPLSDVLADLEQAMAGMDDQTKNATKNIIFSTFGLQAFNKMTVSSTEKVDELRKGLQEAGGAAAQMAETQLDNLQGRLTIMGSAAEALGIAFYEVFEKELSRGVQAGTNALTRMQKAVTSGGLGESLHGLAESVGNLMEGMISLAERALPVLIDTMSWFIDHLDIIAAGFIGITAAHSAYNIAIGASEAITKMKVMWTLAHKTALDAETVATAEATAAQLGLNTAMLANPAVMIAAAIAGLTVALGAFILFNADALSGMSEAAKAARDEANALRELNDELAESSASYKDANAEREKQAGAARKLAAELTALQESDKPLTETMGQQKVIIDQLNRLIPDLNLSINETTGELNMATDALNNHVDAWDTLNQGALADARASEILQEQIDLNNQLTEAKEKQKAIQEEYNQAVEYWADICSSTTAQSLGPETYGPEPSVIKIWEDLNAEIAAGEARLEELEKEYGITQEVLAETAAIEEAAEKAREFAEATKAIQKAQEEMIEAFAKNLDSFSGLFDQMASAAEQSLSQINENLTHNAEMMRNYGDNIKTAMDIAADNPAFDQIVQHILDMGTDGAAYLDEFVKAAQGDKEEFQAVLDSWTEYLESVDYAKVAQEAYVTGSEAVLSEFEAELEARKETAAEKAVELTEASANAITENSTVVSDAVVQVVDEAIVLTVEEKMQEISDSGLKIVETIATGMKGGKDHPKNASKEIINLIIETFKTEDWPSVGISIDEGIAEGIRRGAGAIESAAKEAAKSALSAAKAELDIKSPSGRFREEVGQMIPPGIQLGIEDKIGEIDFDSFGDYLVSGARSVVSGVTVDPVGTGAGSAIDYDLLGEKMAEALEHVSVDMDGRTVGRLTSSSVNESMARQSDLERRGVQ